MFSLLAAVLRISVPYVLGALGGLWSERAGVVALGLEGMLLTSAFTATLGAYFTHSALLGLVAGVAGGVVVAALYALLVLRFRGDQIVCGVALNLFADGATRFLLKALFGSSSNSPVIGARLTPSMACPVAMMRLDAARVRPRNGRPSGEQGRRPLQGWIPAKCSGRKLGK